MSFLSEWRASRERRRRANAYLGAVLDGAETRDVEWLAIAAGRDVASRELTFARRALALIVAERDALDDRTASDVARELVPIVDGEARRDPQLGRAWSERAREYTAAFVARGSVESPTARFARVLLNGASVNSADSATFASATQFVQISRAKANEALRAAFGSASLPEDVRPSAIQR